MVSITNEDLKEMSGMCLEAMQDYESEIDGAYLSSDDDLTIALSLKIKPGSDESKMVEVGISFVTGKVKDKFKKSIGGRQREFNFKMKEVKPNLREILSRQYGVWVGPGKMYVPKVDPIKWKSPPWFAKKKTMKVKPIKERRYEV